MKKVAQLSVQNTGGGSLLKSIKQTHKKIFLNAWKGLTHWSELGPG